MLRIYNFVRSNFFIAKALSGGSFFLTFYNYKKLFVCIFWWKFFTKTEFVFHFRFRNTKFEMYLSNRMDIAVLYEVFVKKEYEFDYKKNPKTIIDLGANIGDTAIFYAILFPEAKIFAVEPNSEIFTKLVKNTKQFINIIPIKCAIGENTGKIKLFTGGSHLGSSIIVRKQNKNEENVDSFSLSDFFEQFKIEKVDILKFDIEGAEESLFKNTSIKSKVENMVGEVHEDLTSSEISSLIDGLNLKNFVKKTISKDRYIIFGNL